MKHTDGAGRIKEARRYAEARLAYLKEAAGSPDAAVQQLVEAVRVLLDPAVKTSRDYPLALRMFRQRGRERASPTRGVGWKRALPST